MTRDPIFASLDAQIANEPTPRKRSRRINDEKRERCCLSPAYSIANSGRQRWRCPVCGRTWYTGKAKSKSDEILELLAAGHSQATISRALGVARATIRRVVGVDVKGTDL